MSTPPLVAKRGRPRDPKRLQKIIEAASEQILEFGYDRVSMEAVAQAAGVSKMTLYNNFANKDALFEACVAYRTHSMFSDFNDQRLDPARPAEALLRISEQFVALMRADDVINIHRVMFGLANSHNDMCARFYNAGPKHVHGLVRDFLAAAVQANSVVIDDLDGAADQFLALNLGRPHLQATLGLGKPSLEADTRMREANVALFMARYAVLSPTPAA